MSIGPDNNAVLDTRNIDIEKEKARMLSDNLTDEAKAEIKRAFVRYVAAGDEVLKGAEDVTDQTGDELVAQLREEAERHEARKKQVRKKEDPPVPSGQ